MTNAQVVEILCAEHCLIEAFCEEGGEKRTISNYRKAESTTHYLVRSNRTLESECFGLGWPPDTNVAP